MAIAGIISGLLAVGLPFAFESRYVDDGTVTAFLLVLLCFASWLPAEIGRDLLGAAAGAAAFGYLLFLPASAAFDEFGFLESGSWLGLCTALIPIGAIVGWSATREPHPSGAAAPPLSGIGLSMTFAGLVLIVVGIWLEAVKDGSTYWSISSSGHAVGILTLLLVALNVVLVAGPAFAPIPRLLNLDVLVAAATFGFVEAGLVSTAFEDFGSLGAGGWLEAGGGVLLLAGVLVLRSVTARAAESAVAMAPASAQ